MSKYNTSSPRNVPPSLHTIVYIESSASLNTTRLRTAVTSSRTKDPTSFRHSTNNSALLSRGHYGVNFVARPEIYRGEVWFARGIFFFRVGYCYSFHCLGWRIRGAVNAAKFWMFVERGAFTRSSKVGWIFLDRFVDLWPILNLIIFRDLFHIHVFVFAILPHYSFIPTRDL